MRRLAHLQRSARVTPPCTQELRSLKLTFSPPEKKTPGKGDSYWKPPFLGAMLVLGREGTHRFSL